MAAIARESDVWISVDTSKALVIREAANAGAHILNDIRSFSERGITGGGTERPAGLCDAYAGEPRTMQQAPHYQNVVREVYTYLEAQVARCVAAGIEKSHNSRSGLRFRKTLAHNYQLLDKLDLFHNLGLPVLAGMSRKSMIGQLMDIPG